MGEAKIFGGTFLFIIGLALIVRVFILLQDTDPYNDLAEWTLKLIGLLIFAFIAAWGASIIWNKKK